MEIPGVPLLLTCILTINGELFDASSLETGVDTHRKPKSARSLFVSRVGVGGEGCVD